MSTMSPSYKGRISLTLIRNVLLAGILIGLVIVPVRLKQNIEDKAARIDFEMKLLIEAVKGPAAEAAYNLDENLARKAAAGVYEHPAVANVVLIDDFGSILANLGRVHSRREQGLLSAVVSGWREYYDLPLSYLGRVVGRLTVGLDSPAIAAEIMRDSILNSSLDVVGLLVMAAILLGVFHVTLTRPMLEVNRRLAAIEPSRKPGSRLDAPRGHEKDELGLLVESVNRLFERIEQDIERREIIQEQLRRAKENAEEASKAKSEFLANMSHEVRTPLNAILGMTEMTLDSDLDREQRANLRMVLDSGETLLRVMNDILDVSKVDAGIVEVSMEPLHPAEIVERAVDMFLGEARTKGVELVGRVDENVPKAVVGDRGRVRQVLFNLLGNAIKFTDRGRVELRVERVGRLQSDKAALKFSVSDTGMGIPEEQRDKIFEAFTQLDGSYARQYQGAGLGLAIVSRFVRLMGGRVEVESELGRGSVFSFTLAMPVTSQAREEAAVDEEDVVLDLDGRRVLLAEDNPVNKLYAVKLLEDLGLDVTAVDDGREALAALKKERFDVAVLDVQMPGMDGLAVAEAVRGNGAGLDPDTPLVAMTAHAMKGDREKFLAAGMDDYVAKPVDRVELKKALMRAMAGRIEIG
jgi:signal transduction histidine kinase/ActR/RegA family two-component response regulator